MSFSSLSPKEFLDQRQTKVIIDVRSPGEYEKAHIPFAHNLPLFSNEERAMVGTAYTKQGHDIAVELGLKLVGPKLHTFVKEARQIANGSDLIVHCWRGGMRSASMAWLLDTAGFKVSTLRGGYKTYRKLCQDRFEIPWRIVVLSGATGSGKTEILGHLKRLGEQVVDLEGLANHKGSAFGALGQRQQPSTEMFENLLFEELLQLDPRRRIWVEDESKNVGSVFVPHSFFSRMLSSPVVRIAVSSDIRVERLVREYGCFSKEELVHCVMKIEKRLGYDITKMCVAAIEEGNLRLVAELTLRYYDKSYAFSLERRCPTKLLRVDNLGADMEANAIRLLSVADSIIFEE